MISKELRDIITEEAMHRKSLFLSVSSCRILTCQAKASKQHAKEPISWLFSMLPAGIMEREPLQDSLESLKRRVDGSSSS